MKIILTIVFILIASVAIKAQCTTQAGFVCIPQETANRYYKLADEYIALKDAYNKLLVERGASDAVVISYGRLVEDYKQAISIRDSIDAQKNALLALYEKTIQMYAGLVEKLETKLNAPKSAWSKFLSALKTVAILAAGIALGRGGL
jgi:hypothetical protein